MAYDESYSFLKYARKSFAECIADYDSTNNHLLNSWVMHWLYQVGGPHEVVLRLGVFAAGVLLVPATYLWAKEWSDRPTAAMTAILVAIAPALITYSVDARGYTYVTLAAVCMDLALRRQLGGTEFPRHWAIVGIISAVLGLWAMPIMLYAVLGSTGSYLVVKWLRSRSGGLIIRTQLVSWGWQCYGGGPVGAFAVYARVCVSGTEVSERSDHASAAQREFPDSHSDKLERCLGMVDRGSPSLCHLGSLAGCWPAELDTYKVRSDDLALSVSGCGPGEYAQVIFTPAADLSVVVTMDCLGCRQGATTVMSWCRCPQWSIPVLATGLMGCGFVSAVRAPVLIYPEERLLFLDVPAVVAAVHTDLESFPDQPARLLSPVPVDYPTRFYVERQKSRVQLNDRPQPGEVVYAVVLEGDVLKDTFRRSPVELPDWPVDSVKWTSVTVPRLKHHSGKLRLMRAQLP